MIARSPLVVLLWASSLAACGDTVMPPAQPPVAVVPVIDGPAGCAPDDAAGLVACVERARLEADVRLIAEPRPAGSAAHARVRELCAERLAALGFEVERHDYGTGVNVIGTRTGVSRGREQLLVSAHYDHLDGCSGADDDASGIAVVLELGRVLATARFDRTLLVACWDEGDRGQAGSRAYAERARARGDRLIAALVLEAVGYASSEPESQRVPDRFEEAFPDAALALMEDEHRGDFLLLVSDGQSEATAQTLQQHARHAALDTQRLWLTERLKHEQRDVHRSDHSSFWQHGLPALLLTDTGSFRNPRFHCASGDDTADTIDWSFTTRVAQTAVGAVAELLKLRPY